MKNQNIRETNLSEAEILERLKECGDVKAKAELAIKFWRKELSYCRLEMEVREREERNN